MSHGRLRVHASLLVAPALRGGASFLIAWALGGCADVTEPGALAERDRASFDARVWPVLVRDCGFSECHGSTTRFFRVLGPGHERLDPAMRLTEPVTQAELQLTFDRARSLIDPDDPAHSPLLRKPLEVAAGGSGHEGTDAYGRDVYRTAADPSFRVLVDWVLATAPAVGGTAQALRGGASGTAQALRGGAAMEAP